MLELNFGSDFSELDNMVEGDIVRLRATLQGMEATKSTMAEHVQILEKDINRLERAILSTLDDDLMVEYQCLLQDCKHKHTYFANTLSMYEKVYRAQFVFLHYLLHCKIDTLPNQMPAGKKAKKSADEPTVPSASVPARVERPSSPSY